MKANYSIQSVFSLLYMRSERSVELTHYMPDKTQSTQKQVPQSDLLIMPGKKESKRTSSLAFLVILVTTLIKPESSHQSKLSSKWYQGKEGGVGGSSGHVENIHVCCLPSKYIQKSMIIYDVISKVQ